MADSYTANLNLRKPEVGAAKDNWGNAPLGLNGDMDLIDSVFQADGLSTVGPTVGPLAGTPGVGLRIGGGRVLRAIEGTILATADRLELSDATDPTKLAHILLTDLATGAHNNYFLPPLTDILVGQTQAQLLTAKTVPDPSGGVIDNSQQIASAHWVQAVISAVLAAIPPPYVPATGDIMPSAAVTKLGWVPLDARTIGNAGSGAVYANADAQNLFNLFWAINGGTWPIVGGRGGTAAADWAALKTIAVPDTRGRTFIGLNGIAPNPSLLNYFGMVGEATHQLTTAEMPSHTHSTYPHNNQYSGNSNVGGLFDFVFNGAGGVTGSTGTDTPHNNVQPSMGVVYWMKL